MAIRQPTTPAREAWRSQHHGQRMSEAEFLALPEDEPYLEFFDGRVWQKPMPNRAHSMLVKFIILAIAAHERLHGGNSGPERRVRLRDGSAYRIPDTAYWAPGVLDEDDSVPTIAVEVRSPGQNLAALRRKCRAFRAGGVAACWLIDPSNRSAEVFDEANDGERKTSGDLVSAAAPGLRVSLDELFAVLD